MTASTHACPVCDDAAHLRTLCAADGFTVYACSTCSAEHAWPMPSARELKAFYDRPEWFEGGEKGGYADYDAQTGWCAGLVAEVLDANGGKADCAVLDLGCGYGTHLSVALQHGWRCFGVEPSDHARDVAQRRLAGAAHIVPSVSDLFPHKFDLVLMLDVIEHLPSPYAPLYELFALGAITPETVVVITTPNAGSAEARRDPAAWRYRHPPSHLVYYTPEALSYFLKRLRFADVSLGGLSPARAEDLSESGGLVVIAKGSDFHNFMHERYVPGTWSKIAAYEHVPRYALAKTLVAGKRVLDFGCGTGYGAALMAESAAHVTGLDIDASALEWARAAHRAPNLDFVRRDDLGAGLPDKSFDLVTCFEMIEHVDHATQQQAVASMARLLRDDGVLLISTPNPEMTKLYGANPYHIREMSEVEFRELLCPVFAEVQILRQRVRPGVTFNGAAEGRVLSPAALDNAGEGEPPMAFIALCAQRSLPAITDYAFFDNGAAFTGEFVARAEAVQAVRTEAYNQKSRARAVEQQYRVMSGERNAAMERLNTALHEKSAVENRLSETENQLQATLHEKSAVENQLNEARNRLIAAGNELHTLYRIRENELSSPYFLARQLWRAFWPRLRARLRGK
jgi:2-polyprenyl-3-methyl-5-hydroxy-6-metoxy-1,4-benzoquinol methylase